VTGAPGFSRAAPARHAGLVGTARGETTGRMATETHAIAWPSNSTRS
jgi:hypothetical protein